MSEYFDLGGYARPVTTTSAQAQTWFTRGLVWAYAFNHEEAAACFERAAEADPGCAMAHWGLAYALGPNYNKPWEAFGPGEAPAAVSRAAAALAAAASPGREASGAERALVRALAARYPGAGRAGGAFDPADGAAWNAGYAAAMRAVYRAHPADLDVAALFADALMNLTPWALWDGATGEPAEGAATLEAKDVLERALAAPGGQAHPGVLHMYIHLMEMSARPEDALYAGDLLRDLVPDAGHLRHMPSHIDVLCGDYRGVVAANSAAIAADERFRERRGAMNFYTLYRAHNYHFKIYGAMFLGQQGTALEAADQLAAAIPGDLLRVGNPPMADWLEGFVPMRLHVLIRFGRWQDILATPLPADPGLYCVTTAMTHYARGVARAATGQVGEAATQRGAVRRRRGAGPGVADHLQQHLPGHPRRGRGHAGRRTGIPEGQPRRRVRPAAPRRGTRRRAPLRRAVGLDAAGPARSRRAAARTGTRCRGGDRLPRRPRPRRHTGARLPASRQRLELARVPRMPGSSGQR